MRHHATVLGLTALLAFAASGVRAADLGAYRAPVSAGVECESDQVRAFDSVWLGHFSGGYSHRLGPGEPIVLDWRDEKLCFPNRGSCERYMTAMHRQFHRPEGYYTCLPLR